MHGAGTRVKDHYLNSYRQVFLNVLRTQLGRRGVDSGVEGCLHLAQSVDLTQLLPMADSQLTQASSMVLLWSVASSQRRPWLQMIPRSRRQNDPCTPMPCLKEDLGNG